MSPQVWHCGKLCIQHPSQFSLQEEKWQHTLRWCILALLLPTQLQHFMHWTVSRNGKSKWQSVHFMTVISNWKWCKLRQANKNFQPQVTNQSQWSNVIHILTEKDNCLLLCKVSMSLFASLQTIAISLHYHKQRLHTQVGARKSDPKQTMAVNEVWIVQCWGCCITQLPAITFNHRARTLWIAVLMLSLESLWPQT